MTREEAIQRLVLNEICDDYENVDQTILRHVSECAEGSQLGADRGDIAAALSRLIELGLARAYELSPFEPFTVGIEGMPSLDVMEEDFRTYFHATQRGKDHHLSDTGSMGR